MLNESLPPGSCRFGKRAGPSCRTALAGSPCRGARSPNTCDPGRAMNSPDTLPETVMPAFRDIVREAGALAMRSFQPALKTAAQVWNKSGGSPVTAADMAVDAFLKEAPERLV